MTKYFDKKFWKMLSGFVTIIAVSTIIIFGTRLYQEKQIEKNTLVNLANPTK